MSDISLNTKNTWCPGCGDFGILMAAKNVISKIGKEKTAITAGIGCHAKIFDYINVNGFYGLHGRAVPLACGIKVANPDLKVIVFTGDGDSLNEGISHLIHAAKRNSDITVILHQNSNFALTIKQFTASSPKGFVTNSSPKGNIEEPLNALQLIDSAGASFIARGFSADVTHLEEIIEEAINHKGFSFVEVLQPCVTWYNTLSDYKERAYKMDKTPKNYLEKIKEWDYQSESKIPLGIFKKEEKETFEENLVSGNQKIDISAFLDIKT